MRIWTSTVLPLLPPLGWMLTLTAGESNAAAAAATRASLPWLSPASPAARP
jgi:hypothetical protein